MEFLKSKQTTVTFLVTHFSKGNLENALQNYKIKMATKLKLCKTVFKKIFRLCTFFSCIFLV